MKVRSSIQPRCSHCRLIKRDGVMQIRCQVERRHNQRQH